MIKRHPYITSAVVGVLFTSLSFGLAILFGWITLGSLNLIELGAVATSYACT